MDKKDELSRMLDCYSIGEVEHTRKLTGGIVHKTFMVVCELDSFVAQRLGSMFGAQAVEDQWNIQKYLEQYDFPIAKIVLTKESDRYVIVDGNIWRLLEYIPHDRNVKKGSLTIFEAARTLGRFHALLNGCDYNPKFKIENFHDTRQIISKLKLVSGAEGNQEKASAVKKELDFIVNAVEGHYLPGDIYEEKKTLIHGDPKFDNFLFDNTGIVVGLVDLDTIMRANELIDLGDALRSWSREGMRFINSYAEATLKGYLDENNTGYILAHAKDAMALITLELAARFLSDYFEESYFQWDKAKYPSAAAHNLERCRMYLEYYRNTINTWSI